MRPSLQTRLGGEEPIIHWGANAVEIEAMRYRPRRELTSALEPYDIIQVVSGSPAWAAAVVRARPPIVLQVASPVAWDRDQQLSVQTGLRRVWRQSMTSLTSRIERAALRKVAAVLVMNTAMFNYVNAVGCKHVLKAPPGVNITRFSPAAEWRETGYLLSVCRLNDPRKGLERMVRAYEYMTRVDVSVPPLILAGRARPPESLLRLIGRLGLSSRVAIHPDVSDEELPDLYRGAAVFLQTSHEEGLGLSVLEAMSCGLPVVATETAGSRETVVHGLTGWLVPQNAEVDVPRLVALSVLDVLRGAGAALGARGRKRCVESFSSAATLRRYTETYDALLARETGRVN